LTAAAGDEARADGEAEGRLEAVAGVVTPYGVGVGDVRAVPAEGVSGRLIRDSVGMAMTPAATSAMTVVALAANNLDPRRHQGRREATSGFSELRSDPVGSSFSTR
jgi:hypothetical protein